MCQKKRYSIVALPIKLFNVATIRRPRASPPDRLKSNDIQQTATS
jgi:hypothetical protein